MRYLIDGHNLIGKIPGMSLREMDDEQQLVSMLQSFYLVRRKPIEVYFDRAPAGFAGTRKYGTVTAHFIRQGQTADDAIRDRLLAMGVQAKEVIVVTSDRQVQANAHAAHAQVVSSEEFAREVLAAQEQRRAPGKAGGGGMSSDEIDEWLELFGGDDLK
ncbi:MAG: NYN domain-containing protein [Anaerolineaceae bacterium]